MQVDLHRTHASEVIRCRSCHGVVYGGMAEVAPILTDEKVARATVEHADVRLKRATALRPPGVRVTGTRLRNGPLASERVASQTGFRAS